jgi:hypothetical protein
MERRGAEGTAGQEYRGHGLRDICLLRWERVRSATCTCGYSVLWQNENVSGWHGDGGLRGRSWRRISGQRSPRSRPSERFPNPSILPLTLTDLHKSRVNPVSHTLSVKTRMKPSPQGAALQVHTSLCMCIANAWISGAKEVWLQHDLRPPFQCR